MQSYLTGKGQFKGLAFHAVKHASHILYAWSWAETAPPYAVNISETLNMFDLETVKEALGDETFTALETYVNDLIGSRDAAKNEQITGRKTLKARLAQYEQQEAELLERLGIESFDDLQELPADKGIAEAAKQFETKIKRLERKLADSEDREKQLVSSNRSNREQTVIAQALGAHEFVAPDVVSTFINNRLVWEDEDLLFKSDDGHLVSVKDGVAAFAKTRPELVKSAGAGGAGVRSPQAGSQGEQVMSRAEFENLSPQQRMEASKAGVTLQ